MATDEQDPADYPAERVANICECDAATAWAIARRVDEIGARSDEELDALLSIVYRTGWSNGARDIVEIRRT
tara:strand:- start:1083 stop:1295 length:213 start_codon:yes stop_codon:yes gene_type:complete